MTDRTTITEKLAGDASGTRPLRPVLILAHGPAPERIGERTALPRRETIIGRGEPRFETGPLDDPRVSSRHLVVTPGAAGLGVRDVGGKSGILVHGKRVDAARLQPGDLVQCGRTFLLYRVEPAFDWRPAESALAGLSYLLHLVRQSVERAAAHDLPALITGPSGAGKEPAAREVHRLSRRTGPLVPVNCAALPAELVESELFGHVAGAFTGAGPAKEGLFRRAQGGTLFLDEVGAMPLARQPKLLRAIQERRVRAVGGTREVDVDVRIVAATNEDLPALVRSGGFRTDLYGRLSGALIEMPPSRSGARTSAPCSAGSSAGATWRWRRSCSGTSSSTRGPSTCAPWSTS
ncbi:MAG: hypothetical protein AMXMBFR64_19790 [Myxococcales bacterium]